MPATPAVFGYVDRLGYLYCIDCAARRDVATEPTTTDGYPRPVQHAPHTDEPCDGCGQILRRSAGHRGYTWTVEGGVCEIVAYGGAIVRAPLANPVQSDGNRHGREWWPDEPRYAPLWRDLAWPTATAAREDLERRR